MHPYRLIFEDINQYLYRNGGEEWYCVLCDRAVIISYAFHSFISGFKYTCNADGRLGLQTAPTLKLPYFVIIIHAQHSHLWCAADDKLICGG